MTKCVCAYRIIFFKITLRKKKYNNRVVREWHVKKNGAKEKN